MTAFHYTALDKEGKKKKGVAQADSERQVRHELREQNLVPLTITPVIENSQEKKTSWFKRFGLRKKIGARDLSLITRQLATLLAAGIPLDEALTGLSQQTEKPYLKGVILGVRSRVLEGQSLARGLGDFPSVFPPLYRVTVAAGENSGKLDLVLNNLAEYTEKQHQIKQKIRQALIYPALMTFVSFSIVTFLLIYVVPKIIDVFSQTKQSLPIATVILLAISHFLIHYGIYLLVAIIVLAFIFGRLLKQKRFRYRFDQFLLRLPIIGNAIKMINTARFGRTFGILATASVPILDAMNAANQLVLPIPMNEAILNAIHSVREGVNIHRALKQTNYFSPMFIHLIASGESSGQLEAMLAKASQNQENDIEALIANILTLFEPIMILVMGSIVLFIVLAIMLPIFSLNQM